MPHKLSASLMDQVITEMAESFFENRRQVEEMQLTFNLFVEEFRGRWGDVSSRAGFLRYLLLSERTSGEFLSAVGVDSPSVFWEGCSSDMSVPDDLPFSFTAKKTFINIVHKAYDLLQKACHFYNYGRYDYDVNGVEIIIPGYVTIEKMCNLINQESQRVNTNMTPSAMLQCFKGFYPESSDKMRIAGTSFGEFVGMDEKLAYKQIQFDKLNLKKYPVIPELKKVDSNITMFCERWFAQHSDSIKKMIHNLKSLQLKP